MEQFTPKPTYITISRRKEKNRLTRRQRKSESVEVKLFISIVEYLDSITVSSVGGQASVIIIFKYNKY